MTAGSQAVFPGTARNLLLSLGGVIQEPDTDFTISGSTLNFTTAPVANTTFFAVIFGDMQSTGTPSDGTVLPASVATGLDFTFNSVVVGKGANSVAGNTVLGESALDASVSGGNNTAIGKEALTALTSGADNLAVGKGSLKANTTASFNTGVGTNSLFVNSTGANNTGLGYNSLVANTTASNNTAVGYIALTSNTTGTENVSIGAFALDSNTTGSYNTAPGS